MFAFLQVGNTGNPVVTLQTELQTVLELGRNFVIDGEFGPQTEAAVKAFQLQSQLQVDGMVGSLTAAELNRVYVALQPGTNPKAASLAAATPVAGSVAATGQDGQAQPTNLALLVQQIEHELESQVDAANRRMASAEKRAAEVSNALNQALSILKGVLQS